jgi:hypothetical protein
MTQVSIIIEGPDATGKSTLCRYVRDRLRLHMQIGEGPARHAGDINERITRYLAQSRKHTIVYDRHPAVSQPIYGTIRQQRDNVPHAELLNEFYARKNIFVYCRSKMFNAHDHEVKAYDTPEHLSAVYNNYGVIVRMYDDWALEHANIIYRMGDEPHAIINYIVATYPELFQV